MKKRENLSPLRQQIHTRLTELNGGHEYGAIPRFAQQLANKHQLTASNVEANLRRYLFDGVGVSANFLEQILLELGGVLTWKNQ